LEVERAMDELMEEWEGGDEEEEEEGEEEEEEEEGEEEEGEEGEGRRRRRRRSVGAASRAVERAAAAVGAVFAAQSGAGHAWGAVEGVPRQRLTLSDGRVVLVNARQMSRILKRRVARQQVGRFRMDPRAPPASVAPGRSLAARRRARTATGTFHS
jgi:hypothetical protein